MTGRRGGGNAGPRGHRREVPRLSEHGHNPPGRTERHEEVPDQKHPVAAFFRANPQVLVLLVVCLVLGIGTFVAVLFGLVTAGSDQTTGEPSGAIVGAHTLLSSFLRPIG